MDTILILLPCLGRQMYKKSVENITSAGREDVDSEQVTVSADSLSE